MPELKAVSPRKSDSAARKITETENDEGEDDGDLLWIFRNDKPSLETAKRYRRHGKKLSGSMRRRLLQISVEALMKEGRVIASEGGIITRKTEILPYKPGGEWDLDSSLSKMLSENTYRLPSYRDLTRREVIRTRRCFVILADKSHSLGPTVDYVALAVSVFAEAVRNEQYAVLVFDDTVKTVKSVRNPRDEGEVLEEMLNMECYGATNMQYVFEKAREQIDACPAGTEVTCVLISDCIPTVGRDYMKAANSLPRLEVLLLRNESIAIGESCADELTHLRHVRLKEIRELNNIIDCVKDIVSYGGLEAPQS